MKLNRTGASVMALFFFGGLLFLLFGDPLGGWIWLAVPTAGAAYAIQQSLAARRQEALWRKGLHGRATIVEASPTGVTVNDQARMRLTVDLEVPGIPVRRVTHTALVPPFVATHVARRPLQLPAFVDPQDPTRFLIQW